MEDITEFQIDGRINKMYKGIDILSELIKELG